MTTGAETGSGPRWLHQLKAFAFSMLFLVFPAGFVFSAPHMVANSDMDRFRPDRVMYVLMATGVGLALGAFLAGIARPYSPRLPALLIAILLIAWAGVSSIPLLLQGGESLIEFTVGWVVPAAVLLGAVWSEERWRKEGNGTQLQADGSGST